MPACQWCSLHEQWHDGAPERRAFTQSLDDIIMKQLPNNASWAVARGFPAISAQHNTKLRACEIANKHLI
jgi:hypothetical protein